MCQNNVKNNLSNSVTGGQDQQPAGSAELRKIGFTEVSLINNSYYTLLVLTGSLKI